jgi:hypothetical protein|tara:strand:+ start:6143 stop:6823 length:681 start_codon:yes stop_codon:yes gene_type:complete
MNDIKFICHDKNVLKNFPIVPATDCMPEWYAKLNDKDSIANNMPVRDYVTAGYIIPNAFEQAIGINVEDDIECPDVIHPVEKPGEFFTTLNHVTAPHYFYPHEFCPVQIDGAKRSYYKLKLPWRIETPKGYSTLFFQPYYYFNKGFSIMPFILDTDLFDLSNLEFPCYIKKEVDIKPGEPIVQFIPFKRESWKHKLSLSKEETSSKMNFFLKDMYKRAFHQKKSFN